MYIVGRKGKWGVCRVLDPLLSSANWNMEMKELWSFTECVKFMASLYSKNTSNSSVHFPFLIETLPAIGFYDTLTSFFFYLTDCPLPSLPCWHYYFWFTSQWKALSLSLFCYPTTPPPQEQQIHLHCFKYNVQLMIPDSSSPTWTSFLRYIFIFKYLHDTFT